MGLSPGTLHPLVPHQGTHCAAIWVCALGHFIRFFSLPDDILKQCSVMFTAHLKMKRLFSLYIIYIIINLVHNSLIYLI
jgi:hypothetical protein